jgi:hypothetical protein
MSSFWSSRFWRSPYTQGIIGLYFLYGSAIGHGWHRPVDAALAVAQFIVTGVRWEQARKNRQGTLDAYREFMATIPSLYKQRGYAGLPWQGCVGGGAR